MLLAAPGALRSLRDVLRDGANFVQRWAHRHDPVIAPPPTETQQLLVQQAELIQLLTTVFSGIQGLTGEVKRQNDLEFERIEMRKRDLDNQRETQKVMLEGQNAAIGALAETMSASITGFKNDLNQQLIAQRAELTGAHMERFKLLTEHVDLIPKQVENTVGSAISLYLSPFVNEWSDIKGVINRIENSQVTTNKLLMAQIAELKTIVEATEQHVLAAFEQMYAQLPKPAAEVLPVGPSITVVPEPPKVGSTTTSEVKA